MNPLKPDDINPNGCQSEELKVPLAPLHLHHPVLLAPVPPPVPLPVPLLALLLAPPLQSSLLVPLVVRPLGILPRSHSYLRQVERPKSGVISPNRLVT